MLKTLKYVKKYKYVAIFSVLLTVLNSVVSLLLPFLMSKIINDGISDGNIAYIKQMGVVMIAISGIGVAISILASYCTSKTATGFGAELRRKVFHKVESLSQCDIDKIGTPSLITRTTNDIRHVQDFLLTLLRMIISAPIMLVGGCVMAFLLNPKLAAIIMIIIPVIGLIAFVISKTVIPMFDRQQKKTDRLNLLMREKLGGIRVIRAFNRTEYEDKRFGLANLELTSIALRIQRIFAGLIPLAILLLFSVIIIIIWNGATQISTMDAVLQRAEISDTVGNLQAFVIYILMIIFAVSIAAAMLIMLPRASISAKRINEILDLETMIKNPQKPAEFKNGVSGSLTFESVSFGYPGAKEPVLCDLSFETSAGEVTAIIGGTGSGKSTLVNLIPRFYDVSIGTITIDGADIRTVDTAALRRKIGFIPQQASLFSGTVADNIRLGAPDASDEEIWEALETANAAEFVRELEGGLDCLVSQGGINFSGGQKQRLAIARALVMKSEIFVFDDSFSALDFKTDAMLRAAIKQRLSYANIIIVAQRIGTIMDADRIIVLNDGRIVGMGRHAELMKTCSVYREIAESQLSESDLQMGVSSNAE